MGWHNPPTPWREHERRLSGLAAEAPVSRRKRPRAEPDRVVRPEQTTPYAELHCHSHFSFLDGASSPADLVKEATRLGLDALALTDHDGFAGAPLFAEAGADHGLRTVYGAELTLGVHRSQNGIPDPEGSHLLVLARGVEGYHRLSGAITEAGLRAPEKGSPAHDLDELAERGRGHWVILTGCRKGTVRRALLQEGPAAAARELYLLVDRFGAEHVVVELTVSDHPGGEEANDVLAAIADERGLPVVATGNVHFAAPDKRRLAAAMAAIRARRSIAEMDGWLDLSGGGHLRSGEEMLRRFERRPDAVHRSVVLADELAFDLRKASPRLPNHLPDNRTPSDHLRDLVEEGFVRRYAGKEWESEARDRIEQEMKVILKKEFAGYFIIVHDIVAFAREQRILCQGRGSAASSAVCYALGITAIDSVEYDLPFERFISAHRAEEPDIDVDFDSDRREEVIQWVYETYGRRNAAQVCNVISYRPRMAVRDAAKALGYSMGQQDAWSKQVDGWGREVGEEVVLPPQVRWLATELMSAPRHLGIHSGGMVLTERPIGEVCPIEKARMENRTVLQWDKDGCESMGLVKFDLLGLGMLGALDHMIRLVEEHLGTRWELDTIPKEEPAVYEMLGRADAIGVFQVESRAQIGTLPRLRPERFYELAIEIALIRPGPIQGGAVHPYIRRKTGREDWDYDHPSLKPILKDTLGVPLFQEQLMRMAVVLGDCDDQDVDLLRRAMGSKRGIERIEKVKDKLLAGMKAKGIPEKRAEAIYGQILSFADFGFAESHALSFALLVYASSWFKLHYPAAFLAGLLRNQPMGFYSPQSLVADARRHGVLVLPPDLLRSGAQAGLEQCAPGEPRPEPDPHRYDGGLAVRLGLDGVKGIGGKVAERIVAERAVSPYTDIRDLSRRAGLSRAQLEALATAGALDEFGLDRRQALWMAGYAEDDAQLPGSTPAPAPPSLPAMTPWETTLADLWATRVSTDVHPVQHFRALLTGAGILSVTDLLVTDAGRRVHVAGLVTHRQRPGTAHGITFLNLEDETGMLNVVCSAGVMKKYRPYARNRVAVIIRGRVERQDGVTNLLADRVGPIDSVLPGAGDALQARQSSRDFR